MIGAIKKISFGKNEKSQSLNPILDNYLKEVILRNQPKIKDKINEILELIDDIPEKKDNTIILLKDQKEFYKKILKDRLDKIITPAFNKIDLQLSKQIISIFEKYITKNRIKNITDKDSEKLNNEIQNDLNLTNELPLMKKLSLNRLNS